MNVLIIGARTFVSADWFRRFENINANKIILADSLAFPFVKGLCSSKQYRAVASAKNNPQAFIDDILTIVSEENIDLLIPTYEEIFYISKFAKSFPSHCQLFLDDFEKLSLLHNKYDFINLVTSKGSIRKPETFYMESESQLNAWIQGNDIRKYILKPVFSRFSSHVVLDMSQIPSPYPFPAVVQEKITGLGLCTYSIAKNGEILAHCSYIPKYTSGLGTGIYFEPYYSDQLLVFCQDMVKKLNFTGQIGFDFFKSDDDTYVPIECNPRATSGLHLVPRSNELIHSIWKKNDSSVGSLFIANKVSSIQLIFPMLICFFDYIIGKNALTFLYDMLTTQSLFGSLKAKRLNFYQAVSIIELLIIAQKNRISLDEAIFYDAEWNGDEIIASSALS